LSLLVFLQGCDSIIERTEPSTSVSQETALSTPDAIQGIRASMYDRFHTEEMSTDWLLGPSAIADNTYFRSNQGRHQGLNLNELREGIATLADRSAYDDLYALINDANILISGIEEGVLPQAEANKLRAEGLFMRALGHHHAVRIFGYDPDGQGGVISPNSGPGAGFELGVVIRTTPTLNVADAIPQPRSTVPEVYTQIENDLTEAISLFSALPDDVVEDSPFFVSEAAAQGLLARVNLYQRDWAEADTRAQNAIDLAASLFGSDLASGTDELIAIFDETTGNNPEAIFTISTDPILESPGVNEAISAYTALFWLAQLPTQDLVGLYEADDQRLDAWYVPCYDEINDTKPTGCDLINDNGFELAKYSSERNLSQYADNYAHLRIAEMVLIQAEARLNTSGVPAAIERLNDLRTARGASALDPANFDFDAAYDAILDERRRELVAEGHRFFDLKRLGRDIQKAQGRDDIPFNDFKILDDLPPEELEVNPDLVQNPGYS
jgi:hypothetical protein